MARLCDLSNDIMLMIIPLVSPDDLESFTSTCRGIYKLATEDLEKHRALKREHAVHKYGNAYDDGLGWSPSQLLDEILSKPRTAFYVQEILLHRHSWIPMPNLDPGLQPEDVQLPYSEETSLRVRATVSKLASQDEVAKWLWYIRLGSETHIISLFLLLLPNLSTLRITCVDEHLPCLHRTISRITTMKGPGAPLSRLRHAQVSRPPDFLGLVAAIPSLLSIEGVDMWVCGTEPPLGLLVSRTSNVRDLVLTQSSINSKILFRMLGDFKALRSFVYDLDYRYEKLQLDERGKFDPFWVLSGLAVCASSTLESLTVLSHDKGRRFMGDMRNFKKLRNLRTESQLLLSEIDSHRTTLITRTLPPKLETLELECSGQGDETIMAKVIANLAELKPKYVPALEKVKVITRNGIEDFNTSRVDSACVRYNNSRVAGEDFYTYEALVEACKAQGFELSVKKLDLAVLEFYKRGPKEM